MKKKFSASQIALWILLIISAVVLVMFFCVGFNNQETLNNSVYNAPQYTGLLLVWLYALVIICTGAVLVFAIVNGISAAKTRKKGAKRTSLVGPVFLFMLAAIVVSYLLSSAAPVRLGDQSLFEEAFSLKLTDTCLYSIYALLVVSIVAAVLAMLGVFKGKIAKK